MGRVDGRRWEGKGERPITGSERVGERGERGDEGDSHSLSIDCLWKGRIEDRLKIEQLPFTTMKLY